jgi:hypothetical protein
MGGTETRRKAWKDKNLSNTEEQRKRRFEFSILATDFGNFLHASVAIFAVLISVIPC